MADGTDFPELVDQNQQDIVTLVSSALQMQSRVPGRLFPLFQLQIVADDLTGPEFYKLRQGRLFAVGLSVAAVAAQLPFAFLQGADGLLSTVTRIEIFNRNAALQSIAIGYQAAAPAAGGAGTRGQNRDSRSGFGSGRWTNTLLNGGNNAAPTVPSTYVRALIAPNSLWVCEQPWVLTGAASFLTLVNDLTVNQTLDVQIYWRERVLLDTET